MKLAESFGMILKQIEKEKGLSANDLKTAIEAAFLSAYKKKFGGSDNIKISFSKDMTELNIYNVKKVVNKIDDPENDILLEKAKEIDENINLGEELLIPVSISSEDFGRLSTNVAKQVISQKLKEAEKKRFYEEYSSKKNDIVLGFVQRLEKNNIIVRVGKYENVLLPAEQIPNEKFRLGDPIKVYLIESTTFKGSKQISLSRANPGFVRRLFEIEVPEISEGIIAIKGIVREAGYKTKIAISSLRENFDPIGACIGPKRSRIKAILSELGNEKIDIIEWTANQEEYVKNSLAPATVNKVTIKNDRYAHVVVPSDKLSLAIGKDGLNVKLASKLTGLHIEIESED